MNRKSTDAPADALPPRVALLLDRARTSPVSQIGREARFLAAGGVCVTCFDSGRVGLGADTAPVFCPDCAVGAQLAAKERATAARRAADERAATVAALTARAGLEPFQKRTLATWPGMKHPEGQDTIDRIAQWAAAWPANGASLALFGPVTGTGKSTLAAALLRERIASTAQEGYFISASELIQRLRPSEWQDSSFMHRARYASAIVLDDLGVDEATRYVRERLYYIIDGRYVQKLWTVYTTNMRADTDLRDALGERLYWRVREQTRWIEPGTINFRDR